MFFFIEKKSSPPTETKPATESSSGGARVCDGSLSRFVGDCSGPYQRYVTLCSLVIYQI